MSSEDAYWPVRLLKMVARLPHEYSTWIGAWHSVPNGDPAKPYAPGTPFTGVVVTPVVNCPPEARAITTGSGKEISLLAFVPLHPAEMDSPAYPGNRCANRRPRPGQRKRRPGPRPAERRMTSRQERGRSARGC